MKFLENVFKNLNKSEKNPGPKLNQRTFFLCEFLEVIVDKTFFFSFIK